MTCTLFCVLMDNYIQPRHVNKWEMFLEVLCKYMILNMFETVADL